MISKKQVIHIANLSRIEISDKEAERFQKDFSDILNYFDLLKKAKTFSNKKNDFCITNFRKDEIVKFPDFDGKGKYIKVQKIYDN
ncbi:MAG: aspartyl/glutamyl-tRNA amidotransferase subunit C [Candidatus Pacebacteria bacterium]|nr:aspartyl/glutamyl-tRNA amidotransferase subunit C [Candidatus Paceibacterota bacterium]